MCSATTDTYSRITDKIIADLEKGNLTWRMPWSADHLAASVKRPLRWNNLPYTGINIIVLWSTSAAHGYESPYWMTFKQANEMKAHIRSGEKGSLVVYADKIIKEEETPEGKTKKSQIPFLKGYTVFNAHQIAGLPEHYYHTPEFKPLNAESRNERLEAFFAATKADIVTGAKASYSITVNQVTMPPFESFLNAEGYYATLAHEMTHWTRHPSRLNRDFGRKVWGDEGYAKEELVAEIGSCFLAADLGIEPETREDHAAYIQSWLTVLRNDKRFIFTAASYAQKAAEFLHGLQPPSI